MSVDVFYPLFCIQNRPLSAAFSCLQAGVTHIILAVNYQPEAMYAALAEMEKKYNVKITCSKEDEPLGTAGPLRLAKDIIMDPSDSSDSFFVFNRSACTCFRVCVVVVP
jgi:mannose-1-phosphate guanylyltransferase